MSTFPSDAEREAVAQALRKSRLTWGTHSDRWGDTPWQRDFWGEAVDIALAALAPHVAALVRAERAAAWEEGYDVGHRAARCVLPPDESDANPYAEEADR